MSALHQSTIALLILNAFFANAARAEIKPTGRPKSANNSRLRSTPLQQNIRLQPVHQSTATPSKLDIRGLNVGVGAISYGNSVVTLGAIANPIEMAPGTTQTIEVPINKNGYSGNLYFATVYETDFSDPASVAAQQQITATQTSSSPTNTNGSPYADPTVRIEISVSPAAQPGTEANIKLMGHNVPGNQTINPRFFTISVVQPAESTNYAECFFAPLDGTDPMYTTGWAAVTSSFAVFDANNNGVLDTASGTNYTPFPAFPTATGGTTAGKAYANPNGDQANIIVSGVFNGDQMFALHLKTTADGNLYPIMAMVGELGTGELMVQDLSGWTYDFEGSLPANGQAGSIGGSITFTPFFYDGFANEFLGNTVSIYFNATLQPDA